MGVAAGDYDNDGRPDLFVTGVRENILYRNRGDGTFEDVTAAAGVGGDGTWSVAAGWFDFDNDGRLDLFVVRYVAWDPATEPRCGEEGPAYRAYCHPRFYAPLPNALYRNLGDGKFRDVSAESGIAAYRGKGMGVAFADYDHDGRQDIFVTNLSNECFTLFRNLGRGIFSEVSQSAGIAAPRLRLGGWSTGMFDFNNDGFKDLFTAGSHTEDNIELTSSLESRQPVSLFLSRGDGTFEYAALPGKAFHRGAAFGDFNRDGRIDAVVTRIGERPLVLTNLTDTGNRWLAVRLRGHRSNRDGIGARIHVVTDSGSQWNHVTTSVGYAGSSEPVAHFGLGADATVRLLEIEWPSGARQQLENLAADRYLEIEKPD
jgi:hypothetical protein